MMRATRSAVRTLFIAALACAAAPANADSWAAPKVTEEFSASREYFVRVIPGGRWGDTVGFGGKAKGEFATAEFYRRERDRSYRLTSTVPLLNPVAPVRLFVSNRGELVTTDNWHNLGYGQVVAVYDRRGKLVRSYTLADFFSTEEIQAWPHSVSSIHWHEGPVYINQDQRMFYLMIESGRDLVLGLQTGRYALCETRDGKYLCRNSNTERRWLPYTEVVPER